ncbi:hypothetical protein PBI_CHE12_82 [Mycobacterium phage Che12]|uniref:Uncharacterized protein n=1 Tax=Mycobacterium phage Che12 TaxID=2911435 RepID=Q1A0D5_9CAUD|nr:gp82 [Mycobacterium phage Che12]ABE67401.1 hypothetical protein PBI_CHE12_82 [Mycobacterium phage Che12]
MPEYPANLPIKTLEDIERYAAESDRSNINVLDPTACNNNRARWSAAALHTYAKTVGSEDVEQAISDMLGDLLHLCDAAKLDFSELYDQGRWHYAAELGGE